MDLIDKMLEASKDLVLGVCTTDSKLKLLELARKLDETIAEYEKEKAWENGKAGIT